MKRFSSLLGLFAAIVTTTAAQWPEQRPAPQLKSPVAWFQRASDQMNLRMPGSAAFHMEVKFHAFPGVEVLGPKETPQVMTGDGVYEETWLAPHKWRREITFGGYHAVEVESEKGRKMLASSEYEPSRALMLLRALLEPVPRNFSSREFRHEGASGWKIETLSNPGITLVRISQTSGQFAEFTDAFYLVPHGLLLSRNQMGLTTTWTDDVNFAGKAAARHIAVKAGDRDLLTADVSVDAQVYSDSTEFDLPTGPADAAMTLRPLQHFEIRDSGLLSSGPIWPGGDDSHAAMVAIGVIDRSGRYREVELIGADHVSNDQDLQDLMNSFRHLRWRPITIDGYKCETQTFFTCTKIVHGGPITR